MRKVKVYDYSGNEQHAEYESVSDMAKKCNINYRSLLKKFHKEGVLDTGRFILKLEDK